MSQRASPKLRRTFSRSRRSACASMLLIMAGVQAHHAAISEGV
jgi:hypothetical protein